jgi:hypothetical protein
MYARRLRHAIEPQANHRAISKPRTVRLLMLSLSLLLLLLLLMLLKIRLICGLMRPRSKNEISCVVRVMREAPKAARRKHFRIRERRVVVTDTYL